MKKLLLLFTALSLNFVTYAQCDIPEPFSGNTGANMTVMLTPGFISSLTINDPNAYVVATTDDGMVVGSQPVFGVAQTSLAVWGDDSSTPEIDGALTGASINLSLVDGSILYTLTAPTPISYVTSGMSVQMTGASPELCGDGASGGDCSFPGYFDGNMVWPNGSDIQSNIGMCTTLDLLPFEGGTYDARTFASGLTNQVTGVTSGQFLFDTDGNLIPHVRGTSYGNFAFRYGGNQMASDNNETLRAKSERNALSVFTTYQITDNTRLKVDVFANRSGSEESGDSTGGPYLYDGFGGDLEGGDNS